MSSFLTYAPSVLASNGAIFGTLWINHLKSKGKLTKDYGKTAGALALLLAGGGLGYHGFNSFYKTEIHRQNDAKIRNLLQAKGVQHPTQYTINSIVEFYMEQGIPENLYQHKIDQLGYVPVPIGLLWLSYHWGTLLGNIGGPLYLYHLVSNNKSVDNNWIQYSVALSWLSMGIQHILFSFSQTAKDYNINYPWTKD